LNDMALVPCHFVFQFYSRPRREGRYLSCHVNIRSSDVFLGLPFNIASYALLTNMVAQVTNHEVDELIVSLGDAHIYKNHLNQTTEQLMRNPHLLPKLKLNLEIKNIDDFTFDDIKLIDYKCHPKIIAEISV
jgi:thymidylate synthase